MSWLSPRFKLCNFVNSLSHGGMEPVSWLPPRFKLCSVVERLPRAAGMVPDKGGVLLERSKVITCVGETLWLRPMPTH